MIPLTLKLRKQVHKDIAAAQDVIVKELYKIFDKAVIHGGTAIWRCYNGIRFSEDVNAYIPKDDAKIGIFFENLVKSGFSIEKKKVGRNSIYSSLKLGRTIVRFEALFIKKKGILKEYETAEGHFITIYTLTPEQFIEEKTNAYLKRLKIRDLYDIFFMLRYVNDKKEIMKDMSRLIKEFRKPIDEQELRVLIIEGITPSTEEIIEYVRRI